MELIAAQGKVQMQAQHGDIEVTADKDVTIASCKNTITIAAKEEILLTSGGGYIRIKGGNIEVHCPGKVSVKGATHLLAGPDSMNMQMPQFPQSAPPGSPYSLQVDLSDVIGMNPDQKNAIEGVPYEFRKRDGSLLFSGTTDTQGDTGRLYTMQPEECYLYVGDGEWELSMDGTHPYLAESRSGENA